MDSSPDLLIALGRFHPLLLHFPIGLIAAVVALEIWSAFRAERALRAAVSILLLLASATAVIAAACGLLLARSGGYDEGLIDTHRLWGVGTAILAVTTMLLHLRTGSGSRQRATTLYRLALGACTIALAGAGFYGGKITHGSKTPFESLAAVFGFSLGDGDGGRTALALNEDPFDSGAAQILQSHCYECHGAEKQKSGLRLDRRDAALAGGESGKPAIVPGNAMASRLVEAITLPTENKRAMPPTGKRRLEPNEVLALINWINRGAPWPDANGLRPEGVPPPSATAIEQLRASGFRVAELARGYPLIRVDSVPAGAHLSALAPVAQQVAWLSLAGAKLDSGELQQLTQMPNLTRLELQRSNVRDEELAYVAQLPHLTYLNLYATQISDAGIEHLHECHSLERLYLWQTASTATGLQQLRESLPTAVVDNGEAEATPTPAEDGAPHDS